jgi:YidC/Oxa1 family membrane protein insertase
MNANENKNLIIALVLMLAVWFGFSVLFPPQPKPEAEQQAAQLPVQTQGTEPQVPEQPPVEAPVAALEPTNQQPARNISVETDLYRAVFTTAGARLVSFELKNYHTLADPQSPMVQMFQSGPLHYATLRTTGTGGLHLPADVIYSVNVEQDIEITDNNSKNLIFSTTLSSGLEVIKTFVLHGHDYTIDCDIELANVGSVPLRGTLDFALVKQWDENQKSDRYSFAGPASLVDGKFKEVDVEDLEKSPVSYGEEASWTSFQTKYFLSVVVPGKGVAERTRILKKGNSVENIVETPSLDLAVGARKQLEYFLFIGPKELDLLKIAGHQLDKAMHFGFFDLLAKPLFYTLTFFYGFLKNYGLAIILLTVLIKILFWPLTHKSYASMKAMQKLQPEMQKIRDKFKDDKERLNKELMELYKTNRVNPLGGCLPMLVQIPVFFALYKVLLDSIALRHAPFMFWLTDLSAKDPYYITPILMGASMFVQQRMTPTTADPMQAKIFMMMPVVFTFLFLNFPSGLVIYWLVNNLLTIAQQYYIHKKVS